LDQKVFVPKRPFARSLSLSARALSRRGKRDEEEKADASFIARRRRTTRGGLDKNDDATLSIFESNRFRIASSLDED
jgi:hypothetical protein